LLDDIVVTETGTSASAFHAALLPQSVSYVSQIVWGSIGYSVPALLGTLIAAPERRQILFVGDGSFQLTAQEVKLMLLSLQVVKLIVLH
jgi:indolepyruvate decarboxylase